MLHNKNTIRERGLKENFKVNLYETYFSLTTKDDITCSYLLPILLINHYYKNNEKSKNILTSFSWIHLCFQPLFVNIFMSHFSKQNTYYWNSIFIISFLYGLYDITTLNEFDIQNDPDCIKKNEKNDLCSSHTTSYMGKYHV